MIITLVIIVVPSPQTASGEWGPGYEAKILVWVVKNLHVRVHRITLNNKKLPILRANRIYNFINLFC